MPYSLIAKGDPIQHRITDEVLIKVTALDLTEFDNLYDELTRGNLVLQDAVIHGSEAKDAASFEAAIEEMAPGSLSVQVGPFWVKLEEAAVTAVNQVRLQCKDHLATLDSVEYSHYLDDMHRQARIDIAERLKDRA